MAASKINIVNKALGLLGAEFITSLTEDTKAARFANELYDDTRDCVFRLHPWNSCVKRAALSLTSNTPAYYFSNEFQLPGDWIRIVRPEDDTLEYKIEGDKLVTETSTFNCTYIFRNEAVADYDPLLIDVIASKLAVNLTMPLLQDLRVLDAMNALYNQKLSAARSADAQEGSPEGLDADFWLESRTSGSTLSDYRWNKYTT
tara:strand:+ start:6603 stop:7208 length:606 start_codon:yes stop_codon:yes gene_type:complete